MMFEACAYDFSKKDEKAFSLSHLFHEGSKAFRP